MDVVSGVLIFERDFLLVIVEKIENNLYYCSGY